MSHAFSPLSQAGVSPNHLACRFVDHAMKIARVPVWGLAPTLPCEQRHKNGAAIRPRTGNSARRASVGGAISRASTSHFPSLLNPATRRAASASRALAREGPSLVDFTAIVPVATRWTEVRSNTSLASTRPTESKADSQRQVGSAAAVSSLDTLPPLLTVDEVAAVLRTSRKGVYAMAERRQLPGITRIGRRLLVRRDDLLSWLDERRAASPGGTRR